MAKTGKFIHVVKETDDVTSVGAGFDVTKFVDVDFNKNVATYHRSSTAWSGVIEGLIVKVSAVSGATKVTVRGMIDGETVLPDAEADINFDIGSSTVGSVVFKAGLTWASRESSVLTIYCKTDAGTVTVDEVYVAWSE